jgi:hypothetical protein
VTAVLFKIIIAIIDIYLSGHGYDGLTREYLTWSATGIHLSIGDIVLLGFVPLTAALSWRLYGRDA